ncbi:SGNH/GDSL hydrolase family protein [Lapidilactobacillus luobeiensis]|uniref:SGNH/GDSL hydrolase family protein n=1 Tax=Lapidilactobacillus luobeiensis TaxID=2950371 RepID=UPI0021C46F38|nr:SGNH/GDSL hydrolase family protein [Lapidilactobacillus luobeiensis]
MTDYSNWQVDMFGDSIVKYDGRPQPDGTIAIGYESWLKKLLNFQTVRNFGLSGAPFANRKTGDRGIGALIETEFTPKDLVVIAAGTNDYRLNVPLGRIETVGATFDCYTTIGALQAAIEAILVLEPRQKIILITPLQRNRVGYTIYSSNLTGYQLRQYRNAIIEVGELYALPVWDAYTLSGLNMMTLKEYTLDGLHPNNAGFERISRGLAKFIQCSY